MARPRPYVVPEILGPLGKGAMGEVYRARDTKLNRDVAIKILPELFALERDRITRFGRERNSWRRSIIRTSPRSTASKTPVTATRS